MQTITVTDPGSSKASGFYKDSRLVDSVKLKLGFRILGLIIVTIVVVVISRLST